MQSVVRLNSRFPHIRWFNLDPRAHTVFSITYGQLLPKWAGIALQCQQYSFDTSAQVENKHWARLSAWCDCARTCATHRIHKLSRFERDSLNDSHIFFICFLHFTHSVVCIFFGLSLLIILISRCPYVLISLSVEWMCRILRWWLQSVSANLTPVNKCLLTALVSLICVQVLAL